MVYWLWQRRRKSRSEHALAQATVAAAQERDLSLSDALAFQAVTGKGVQAQVDGRSVRIGNVRYSRGDGDSGPGNGRAPMLLAYKTKAKPACWWLK